MILRSLLPISLLTLISSHPLLTYASSSDTDFDSSATPTTPTPTALILLAAHSIPTTNPITLQDSSWALEPYQVDHQLPQDIAKHINVSLDLLLDRPPGSTVLLFSGGETRRFAGARTEAEGYARFALDLLQAQGEESGRDKEGLKKYRRWINTELYARDSWENLLFGICRFKELTGSYPGEIVAVSYEFKRKRFEQIHAAAIGLDVVNAAPVEPTADSGAETERDPASAESSPVAPIYSRSAISPAPAFIFHGVPASDREWEVTAKMYETETYHLFHGDPGGCGEELARKRMERGWSRRGNGYKRICPELALWLGVCDSVTME